MDIIIVFYLGINNRIINQINEYSDSMGISFQFNEIFSCEQLYDAIKSAKPSSIIFGLDFFQKNREDLENLIKVYLGEVVFLIYADKDDEEILSNLYLELVDDYFTEWQLRKVPYIIIKHFNQKKNVKIIFPMKKSLNLCAKP